MWEYVQGTYVTVIRKKDHKHAVYRSKQDEEVSSKHGGHWCEDLQLLLEVILQRKQANVSSADEEEKNKRELDILPFQPSTIFVMNVSLQWMSHCRAKISLQFNASQRHFEQTLIFIRLKKKL